MQGHLLPGYRVLNLHDRAGIVFVGPGKDSQGGIAKVLENYARSRFWNEYHCQHFASTAEFDSRLRKLLFGAWQLFRFVAVYLVVCRPHAVSVHTSHSRSFYRKLPYLAGCWLFRVPAALHIHPAAFANFFRSGGTFRQFLIRLAGRISFKIVFLSQNALNEFHGIFPEKKMTVLPNPVELELYCQERCVGKHVRPRVLFLGWIVPEKGVYDLVESIPLVRDTVSDALFTFAGNKEVEKLRDVVSRRDLNDAAEVLGWIDGSAKLELLHSSWILVLPSYTEGVPNVLLEAMASSLPIVTTPVGGIPDVLEDGRTAVFIKPGDVHGLARSIVELLQDNEKRQNLAEAALNDASRLYSVDVVGSALVSIYRQHLPSRREIAAKREEA